MPKEYAPGIARKDYPGDDSKIKPKQLLDYIIQSHNARRRGHHYDFRIGNKPMGMYSWATNRAPNSLHEGEKIPAARTNLHTHRYNDFEGEIPAGYGAGTVKKHDKGKALITNKTDKSISFSTAHKKHPERYALVHPGDQYGEKYWQMIRSKMPTEPGAEKQHYKNIPEGKVEEHLKNLPEGHVVQPKLDGALQFVNLLKDKIEMLSHRYSKTTGKPVVHTERFFGERPHLNIPSEYNDSVLLGETYGSKKGKPLKSQETGGLLNATIENSLKSQKDNGTELRNMLFDIAKLKGKPISPTMTYAERKAILGKIMEILPKGKFHLPEEANTPEDALALWNKIKSKAHEHTTEGIVVRPPTGVPSKAKVFPEQDVHIRGFFPGEGKYKGVGVGGFTYSHEPEGKVVGRVGTGLTDEMRKLMHSDPKGFLGRIAKVHSHGQQDSGALRVPAFLGLHEDYPSKPNS